jgi:hypothetical protein
MDALAQLALDRYVMGVWSDRDLELFLQAAPASQRIDALRAVHKLLSYERPQAARALRREWTQSERPSPPEQLEALIRECADRAHRGMPILKELQTDLSSRLHVVSADDPRGKAALLLAKLGEASTLQVHMRSLPREPLNEPDRVSALRSQTLATLKTLLAPFPHLLAA